MGQALLGLVGHHHPTEHAPVSLLPNSGGKDLALSLAAGGIVESGRQSPVLIQEEGEPVVLGAVVEQLQRRIILEVGPHHHIDGEVATGEVALGLRGEVAAGRIEHHGSGSIDVRIVRHARHPEVIGGEQSVGIDRLTEHQLKVIAHAKDAVGGHGRAEYVRSSGVLDAGEHGRTVGDIVVAQSAVSHSSEIVVELHGVAVAKESGGDSATVNHSLAAGGDGIEAVAVVVAAEVGPSGFGLVSLLILQLHVVKVAEVHVESVEAYGQIVSPAAILRRVSIEHPFVLRRHHSDGACRWSVMDGEAYRISHRGVALRAQSQADILVVVHQAGANFQHLHYASAEGHHQRTAAAKRSAIHGERSA